PGYPDYPFLNHWHFFQRHLDPEVSPCEHHRIDCSQDLLKIFNRLRFFNFGDKHRVMSRTGYNITNVPEVFEAADERERDEIDLLVQAHHEVLTVFVGKSGHTQPAQRQIHPLAGKDHSSDHDLADRTSAFFFHNRQLNSSIGKKNRIAFLDILDQSR